MRKKIYPKVDKDTAIKFWFNDNERHYTIRFAWNPLFIIEFLYNDLGWKDFMATYRKVEHNDLENLDKTDMDILAQAISLSRKFLSTLEAIGEANKSPLVVYADDYIEKE